VASARNFGAHQASGEYLLFTDDDMSVPPTYVLKHFEIQKMHGPAVVNCDFEWQVQGSNPAFVHWYMRRYAHCLRPASDLVEIKPDLFLCKSGSVTGCNLSIRKVDFERIGGFDERYRGASCEDQDFSIRLANTGCCRALISRAIPLLHVETHNSLLKICQRTRRGAAETVRFIRRMKHYYGDDGDLGRLNGPISLRSDPLKVIAKKCVKYMLASQPMLTVSCMLIWFLERLAPESALLNNCYDALAAAFFQKGWREGLRYHTHVEPLVFASR
jgi:GT2 family glycosyltransferase